MVELAIQVAAFLFLAFIAFAVVMWAFMGVVWALAYMVAGVVHVVTWLWPDHENEAE